MAYTNDNNSPNNATNNNRRVQFSVYAKNPANTSTVSLQSIPNANPLASQESMPYRPELEQYNNSSMSIQSPPVLSPNIKSIEINNNIYGSNNSTPESINEPIPSKHTNYDSKSLNMKLSSLSQHMVSNTNSMTINNLTASDEFKSDQQMLPLTNDRDSAIITRNQTQPMEYDMYQRQDTITRNHPAVEMNNSTNSIPGFSPNMTSVVSPTADDMAIGSVKDLSFNKSIPAQTVINTQTLSLNKHFSNDKQAFETWMACCDIQDETFGYYSALYPLLCEIFAENTKCSRVPRQSDLEEVILKHGAKKMKVSKFDNDLSHLSGTIPSEILSDMKKRDSTAMNKHLAKVSQSINIDTVSFDFDNPHKKPKYLVTIKYKSFFKFWKWFMECCKIIRELSHLWDANNQSALQCNLFCGREESQQILEQAPQGTFMLRLSSVIKGGIVLTYCEPSFSKKDKHFKHTILIRRNCNQYELRKKKSNANANKKKAKLTDISTLIRSFVKIKFLYTPHNLYPKKSVF